MLARDIAPWLVRRLTTLTLRELAEKFSLAHPDSLSNLARRAEQVLAKSSTLRREVEALRNKLLR